MFSKQQKSRDLENQRRNLKLSKQLRFLELVHDSKIVALHFALLATSGTQNNISSHEVSHLAYFFL